MAKYYNRNPKSDGQESYYLEQLRKSVEKGDTDKWHYVALKYQYSRKSVCPFFDSIFPFGSKGRGIIQKPNYFYNN